VPFFVFRRHSDPPPPDDQYTTVFIDQHGDALSIWLGTLHIQFYRAWWLPFVGFEHFDQHEDD
jgi:hypothetical protein